MPKEDSVVTTVRLPPDLHKKVTQASIAQRRSFNAYVIVALDKAVEKK